MLKYFRNEHRFGSEVKSNEIPCRLPPFENYLRSQSGNNHNPRFQFRNSSERVSEYTLLDLISEERVKGA